MTLTTDLIRRAYSLGLFPMGDPDTGRIDFYEPHLRAIFPLSGMRVSRSLRRTLNRGGYRVTFDHAFEDVMRSCLRPTDNWITEDLIAAYCAVHDEGWGHSCEVWIEDSLAGGVYGLALGGCFCAESMFHRKTDAGKIALWALIDHCRELGFQLFDAQVMSKHLGTLGAVPMPQGDYLLRLRHALALSTPWS